jgi:hypothetical protein
MSVSLVCAWRASSRVLRSVAETTRANLSPSCAAADRPCAGAACSTRSENVFVRRFCVIAPIGIVDEGSRQPLPVVPPSFRGAEARSEEAGDGMAWHLNYGRVCSRSGVSLRSATLCGFDRFDRYPRAAFAQVVQRGSFAVGRRDRREDLTVGSRSEQGTD